MSDLPPIDNPARGENGAARSIGDDDIDAIDTMRAYDRGPARGIVLALIPAVLVWTGLIMLLMKLMG